MIVHLWASEPTVLEPLEGVSIPIKLVLRQPHEHLLALLEIHHGALQIMIPLVKEQASSEVKDVTPNVASKPYKLTNDYNVLLNKEENRGHCTDFYFPLKRNKA